MGKLKCCPCCGKSAVVIHAEEWKKDQYETYVIVRCIDIQNCGISTPRIFTNTHRDARAEAMEIWNFRITHIKPGYVRFRPCTCGNNRRRHILVNSAYGFIPTYECTKCHKAVSGFTWKEAKSNWNDTVLKEMIKYD